MPGLGPRESSLHSLASPPSPSSNPGPARVGDQLVRLALFKLFYLAIKYELYFTGGMYRRWLRSRDAAQGDEKMVRLEKGRRFSV